MLNGNPHLKPDKRQRAEIRAAKGAAAHEPYAECDTPWWWEDPERWVEQPVVEPPMIVGDTDWCALLFDAGPTYYGEAVPHIISYSAYISPIPVSPAEVQPICSQTTDWPALSPLDKAPACGGLAYRDSGASDKYIIGRPGYYSPDWYMWDGKSWYTAEPPAVFTPNIAPLDAAQKKENAMLLKIAPVDDCLQSPAPMIGNAPEPLPQPVSEYEAAHQARLAAQRDHMAHIGKPDTADRRLWAEDHDTWLLSHNAAKVALS